MIKTWLQGVLPNRTFEQHFALEHQFHGIVQNHIKETYIIRPTSSLGIQMLLDGVQINDQNLHLQSKISVQAEQIKVSLQVCDPNVSKHVLKELKKSLVSQLLGFEKRFYSNPLVQYVESFCKQCVHYETKPFNQCMASCRYQCSDKNSSIRDRIH